MKLAALMFFLFALRSAFLASSVPSGPKVEAPEVFFVDAASSGRLSSVQSQSGYSASSSATTGF